MKQNEQNPSLVTRLTQSGALINELNVHRMFVSVIIIGTYYYSRARYFSTDHLKRTSLGVGFFPYRHDQSYQVNQSTAKKFSHRTLDCLFVDF